MVYSPSNNKLATIYRMVIRGTSYEAGAAQIAKRIRTIPFNIATACRGECMMPDLSMFEIPESVGRHLEIILEEEGGDRARSRIAREELRMESIPVRPHSLTAKREIDPDTGFYIDEDYIIAYLFK